MLDGRPEGEEKEEKFQYKYSYAFLPENETQVQSWLTILDNKNPGNEINQIKVLNKNQRISVVARWFEAHLDEKGKLPGWQRRNFVSHVPLLFSDDANAFILTLTYCFTIHLPKAKNFYHSDFEYLYDELSYSSYFYYNKKFFSLCRQADQEVFLRLLRKVSEASSFFLMLRLLEVRYLSDEHNWRPVPLKASEDILNVLPTSYSQEILKWLKPTDIVQYFNYMNFSFSGPELISRHPYIMIKVLSNFGRIKSLLTKYTYLLVPINSIVCDYLYGDKAQEAYDCFMLAIGSSLVKEKSFYFLFLSVIFNYYDVPPVYQPDCPFGQMLSHISLQRLNEELQDMKFGSLIGQHPALWDYLFSYQQAANQSGIKKQEPELIHWLSMSAIFSLFEFGEILKNAAKDFVTYCNFIKNIKKHVVADAKSSADVPFDSYAAQLLFLRVSSGTHTRESLLENFFTALFKQLSLEEAERFWQLPEVCQTPQWPACFAAMLKAMGEVADPLVKIKLANLIFQKIPIPALYRQLATMPLATLQQCFSIYHLRIIRGRKGLLSLLDNYLKQTRNPLRVLQALKAKHCLAHEKEVDKVKQVLLACIRETQADHDAHRYRLFGTSSRLVKCLMQAYTELGPPAQQPVVQQPAVQPSLCQRFRLFFMTANDKAHAFIVESQRGPRVAVY